MSSEDRVDPLEERVRNTIVELRKLTRGASLRFALNVGKIVVDTLYEGDLSAWRSRARKNHALRTLAARPDLPLSASALYRALAIYELNCRQPGAAAWQHLGVSHLRLVLGLDERTQNALLLRAESEQWTVGRLERETLAFRPHSRPSGGRKRTPPYVKSIRRIFELTSVEALEGLESFNQLDASELGELADKVKLARRRLELLDEILTHPQPSTRAARCA